MAQLPAAYPPPITRDVRSTADPSADGRRSVAIFATVELPSAGAYRLAAPGAIPCSELKFANFSSVRVLRTQGLSFTDYKLRCRSKAAAASAIQRRSRDPARCSRVLARATCDVCPAFSWSVTDASVATLRWPRSARPEATRCRACVGVT